MTTTVFSYTQSGYLGTTSISLPSLAVTLMPLNTGYSACQTSLCWTTFPETLPPQATMYALDRLNRAKTYLLRPSAGPLTLRIYIGTVVVGHDSKVSAPLTYTL